MTGRPHQAPLGNRVAEAVASTIDRRQFLRRMAKVTFFAASVAAAGGGLVLLDTEQAGANPCGKSSNVPGAGCPNGGPYGYAPCGPSPCCSSLGKGCNCDLGNGACSSSGHCSGAQFDIYHPVNCWSCSTYSACGNAGCLCEFTTTCCDCGVDSRYCASSSGRCVAWYLTRTGGPFC